MDPYKSALHVLPLVFDRYLLVAPRVIDVGCGIGGWLWAARDLGARKILGLDLYPPVGGSRTILKMDLSNTETVPAKVAVTEWDLAICVEVAEHLAEDRADGLVGFLCDLAPLVLFSAAVPGQGPYGKPPGGHQNEQWSSYWEEKFSARGYQYRDNIRPLIWQDPSVDWWYTQNISIYSRDLPAIKNELTLISRTILQELIPHDLGYDQPGDSKLLGPSD